MTFGLTEASSFNQGELWSTEQLNPNKTTTYQALSTRAVAKLHVSFAQQLKNETWKRKKS